MDRLIQEHFLKDNKLRQQISFYSPQERFKEIKILIKNSPGTLIGINFHCWAS